MLLETAKSYLFCCFAGPKDAALHHLPRSGMAWTSCGPLPARNGWEGECIPFGVWHPCFVCRVW